MIDQLINILIGLGLGTLLVACIWVPWYILACRRDDRRFDAEIRGMDAGRDKAWRELGVSEETIALFYEKRAEYMKCPWDREPT